MMTALLIIIFITFIGVGVPDSVLGTAWPSIYREFNLPVSLAGYISATVSACTIISSLISSKAINKLGTGGRFRRKHFDDGRRIAWVCFFRQRRIFLFIGNPARAWGRFNRYGIEQLCRSALQCVENELSSLLLRHWRCGESLRYVACVRRRR